MANKLLVGGQAVIEGVMMRAPGKVATAVREPSGKITVDVHDSVSIAERYPILKKPFLRGVVVLGESLVLGMRSLAYSAQMAGEEDDALSNREMAGTMIVAFLMAVVLFVVIPTGAARLLSEVTTAPAALNLFEGGLRLLIFLGYLGAGRFYTGHYGLAVCQLLFGWATLFIWPLIDGIVLLSTDSTDSEGRLLRS